MELYCKICGMKINEKNYQFNENSFLIKNEIDDIKYCPFCGVDKEYFSSKEDIIVIDKGLVDEKTKKILDKAMKLEVFNGEFYEEASKIACSKKTKQMFTDLSRVEIMHAKIHKKIGGFNSLPNLSKLDYTKFKVDSALIEQANIREIHAVEFYNKYIKEIQYEDIKIILEALVSVEKQHIFLTE
ncbi:ferritin family protein [Clostridium sp. DL1XJH146]